MKGNKKYEVFSLALKSKDDIPVIICGICLAGMKKIHLDNYRNVKEYELGNSKDIFSIDYNLSEIICRLAKNGVIAVGASVKIEGVFDRTGGIVGNPFEDATSALGDIEIINEDIFVLSAAGSPGIAFCGENCDALKLNEYLLKTENLSQDERIDGVLKIAREVTDTFIIVSDGTGIGSVGKVIISDYNGEEFIKL